MITCKFEDEGKGNLRHVTVDAFLVEDDKILIVKRSAEELLGSGKYCLPGGFLDRDETTRQAVIREIREETGYKAKVKECFFVNDDPKREGEDRQNVSFIYIMEPIKKVGESDSEVDSIHWFKLDEIKDKDSFAFDHYKTIMLYKAYLKEKFDLPVIGNK